MPCQELFKRATLSFFNTTVMMAILCCQLDYIWSSLKRIHTLVWEFFFIKLFEMGRSTFNPDLLRWKDSSFNMSLYEGRGRKKLALFACFPSLSLTSPFFHLHLSLFLWDFDAY